MAVEPVTAKGIETKGKILAAAERVYDRPGVGRDWFNTELVADEAGVGIATVYRYFDNRVVLMDAIRPDRDREGLREFIGKLKDVERTNFWLSDDMPADTYLLGEDVDRLIEEYSA